MAAPPRPVRRLPLPSLVAAAVVLASPAAFANTAAPLGGIVVLALLGLLVIGGLTLALLLTFLPFRARASGGMKTLAVLGILAAVAGFALGWMFGASQWRPETVFDAWTGVWFALPLVLAVVTVAVAVLRLRPTVPSATRWRRLRLWAWGGPLGFWALAWALLLTVSSLRVHC